MTRVLVLSTTFKLQQAPIASLFFDTVWECCAVQCRYVVPIFIVILC